MSEGIYICSTSSDLADHREALKAVIPSLSDPKDYMDFRYVGVEYYTADEKPSLETYLKTLEEAEYVVILVGWRYGSIIADSDKSIVELEYDYAIKHGKTIFCYFIEEDYPIPPNLIEHGIGAKRLAQFKSRLKNERVIAAFSSPDDLVRKFAVELTRLYKTPMREAGEYIISNPRLQSQLNQCEENNRRYLRTIDSLRDQLKYIVPANPIWATRNFKTDYSLCFVLMPFAEEFYQIYEQAISVASENAGLRCMHAGEIFDNREIVEDIWESICTAQVIVADVTKRNPNVFYELGICHTLGKEVIVITQNSGDVPFDIRHRRYIEYSPKGLSSLKSRLEKTIKTVVVRISDNDTEKA